MAAEIQISEIVDFKGYFADAQEAIKWANKIQVALEQAGKADLSIKGIAGIKSLNDSINQLTTANKNLMSAIGSLDKAQRSSAKTQADSAKASVENAKAKRLEAQAANEISKAALNEAKAATETAKAKKLETQEREKAEKAQRAEQKLIDDIANDYKQLTLAYSEAALRAKNYAIRLGENHPITVQAMKDANDLKTFLNRINEATGNFTGSVGNYKKGFSELNTSMQQLLRETPALAINLNTFFLAISNNLPQFFDAVNKAKQANIDLAESGQKPVPVFQQIVKGLFSVQSALTIGITLVTLYGTKLIDWFNSIGKGGGSIDKLKKQLSGFNEEVRQSSEDLDLFFAYLDRLDKAPKVQLQIDNTNVPELQGMRNELQALGKDAETAKTKFDAAFEVFTKANEVLGIAQNKFFAQASKEAQDAVSGGFVEAVKDKLPERDKIIIEALDKAKANYTASSEQIADLKTTLDVTNKNLDLKTAEIAKVSGEEARKITLDNAEFIYNSIKTSNDAILASDRSTLKERLNALRFNFEAERNLINARKTDVLSDPTASGAEKNAAIKTALTEEKKLRSDLNQAIFREQEEFRLRDLEATKSIFVKQKEIQVNAFKELSENLEFSLQDRLQFQRNYSEAQKQILQAEYRQRLAAAGLSDAEIAAFEKDKNVRIQSKKVTDAELLALAVDYESQVLQLSVDNNKQITEVLRSELSKQQELRQQDVEAIQSIYSSIDLNFSEQYAQDVIALNDSLKRKEISISTYNKRRKKLEEDLSRDILKNTINETLAQLNLLDGVEGRLTSAEVKLSSLRSKFDNAKTDEEKSRISEEITAAQEEYDIAKDLYDKKVTLEKKYTEKKAEESDKRKKTAEEEAEDERRRVSDILAAASAGPQATQTISDAAFDRTMDRISAEMAALEERYAKEKELIDQSVLNQAEKQQKLAELDARYRGQKDLLEKKEAQARRNKAILDKQIAIFSIIINTARSIVEALPNIPKSIAAGVIGAAQLAVAVTAPIPKVFKGKNVEHFQSINNYAGPAIVDEGPDGRGNAPEMIIRENGSIEIGGNKPRMVNLKQKDIVLPAKLTKEVLMSKTLAHTEKALVPIHSIVTVPYNEAEMEAMAAQNRLLNRNFQALREDIRKSSYALQRHLLGNPSNYNMNSASGFISHARNADVFGSSKIPISNRIRKGYNPPGSK